jgi:UDP-N-acetylmuramoyl-tripeptide--D-alanyl-D-alanine ligase
VTVHDWVFLAGAAAASGCALLRWLRVAQKEHYLAGSVTRFEARWGRVAPFNPALAAAALAAAALAIPFPAAGWVVFAAVAVWPVGLGLRGRSSPLAWTARLRRLASVIAGLWGAAVAVGALLGALPQTAVWAAVLVPQLVDLALAALAPIERRLGGRFVRRASEALGRVRPTVIAVTGSYGKTTTKAYVRHLFGPAFPVVASPASFNNRMGLARAINEHLSAGTRVFVAEMGTYGPGEIADLCSWIPPDVAVITAVGPVHLERFGSLEAIARAKSEILRGARAAVVNGDEPLLEPHVASAGVERVIRCSASDAGAEVAVVPSGDRLAVRISGEHVAELDGNGVFAMNLACAVGAALAAGVGRELIASRIGDLPSVEHRAVAAVGASGVSVIDDTYNANPTGVRAAVDRLVVLAGGGATAVVTPGMVELGPSQDEENRRFAEYAATRVDYLLIVGITNGRALADGAAAGRAAVVTVPDREAAVAWVKEHLRTGDAVLYANDLPDHYP